MTHTRGDVICTARFRKRLTLRDVSASTGVPISTISRIENDHECNWSSLAAVARHLGVDLNYLAAIETQEATR